MQKYNFSDILLKASATSATTKRTSAKCSSTKSTRRTAAQRATKDNWWHATAIVYIVSIGVENAFFTATWTSVYSS